MPTQSLAAAVAVALLTLIARAADVAYTVDLSQARNQLVSIEMSIPTAGLDTIDLHMPAWRPGRYSLIDPSGGVRTFEAADETGARLEWTKARRSTWRIQTNGSETITVTYQLFASEINLRTRHADDTHAFLSGSAVFMYTDALRGMPHDVRVIAPERWRVATGLEPHPTEPEVWRAPDYDILVDSPFEIGEHRLIEFDVDGTAHEIVVWGLTDLDIGEDTMIDAFGKIVREQARVFGDMPYDRYVFMIHAGDGLGGGTEHWNSTIMQTRPASLKDADAFERFLGLVSHEMFHTWNVKRLRPAGIARYDYQNENMTSLLWVAEGTTSYYDDLTLVRTGLIETDEYLDRIERSINRYRSNPGRAFQSLEMSSLDAWTKFGSGTSDTRNTTVSFYRKGSLVSMMLDLKIREDSGGAATLDDVMRDLYVNRPLDGGGFTEADLVDAVERATGRPADAFFETYVRGTTPLDLEAALATVGVELTYPEEEPKPDLGVSLSGSRITGIRPGGPAFLAGLIAGDELIAVNRDRLSGSIDAALAGVEPGETVELLYTRRGRVDATTATVDERDRSDAEISLADGATEPQRQAFTAWLGQPWPEDDE